MAEAIEIRKDLYAAMLQALRRAYATFKNPEFHSTKGAIRDLEAILNKVDKLHYGKKDYQTSDNSRARGVPDVRADIPERKTKVPAVRTGPPPEPEGQGD